VLTLFTSNVTIFFPCFVVEGISQFSVSGVRIIAVLLFNKFEEMRTMSDIGNVDAVRAALRAGAELAGHGLVLSGLSGFGFDDHSLADGIAGRVGRNYHIFLKGGPVMMFY
jgi:hypothetical protein